jgi:F420-dependent oxidoreductase-like protein
VTRPRIGLFGDDDSVAHGIDHLVAQVRRAADDGFASYWIPQKFALDALTAIAVAGREVPRMELGTAVIPIQARHPAVLAGQALTTQLATGGRLALGIGVSHRVLVEDRLGIPFDRPGTAMEEYLRVLRPLVHGEAASFHGETVAAETALTIGPVPPCPIILGALGARMLDLAGTFGDGTITWAVGPATLERHTVPRISEAAARADRPAPRVVAGFAICVTDDAAAARARAAEIFRLSRVYPSYRRVLDMEGVDDVGEISMVGTEAEIEDRIGALGGIGVTDLAFTDISATEGDRDRTRSFLASTSVEGGTRTQP